MTLTMKQILNIVICVFVMSLAAGCTKDKVYKIGVSQCSQDDWRKKMNDEIDREIISHEDAVVEVRSADDSSEKQIEDIRYFADNRFDIIIVSPNEAARLTPRDKGDTRQGYPRHDIRPQHQRRQLYGAYRR